MNLIKAAGLVAASVGYSIPKKVKVIKSEEVFGIQTTDFKDNKLEFIKVNKTKKLDNKKSEVIQWHP